MKLRDFLILLFICVVWASNNIVSKIVVAEWHVPPLFYAAVRFAVVSLATLPWLLPAPRPLWRIIVVALLMGGGNFALLFIGFKTASPSAASVVVQLGMPMTTLLSMLMLGEKVRWRRGIGMALTLIGALVVMWHPDGMALSAGLWLVAAAAFSGSLGAVMMKQMEGIRPLRFQAWVGFSSLWPLALASAVFEQGQVGAAMAVPWGFVGAILFSALIVSVIGHTFYYDLIQRYEATLISPLTLMTPLFTIAMGVTITHDAFDLRMGIGASLALLGVLIIALRPNHVMPLLTAIRNRVQ
ncbi:drug/metabolite transporter (DMT)-like permease [Caulobacter ginsengisoli]|uniref:Drug/metabolite transporter (DMT)-like permease n=1 Tax=Caulobacter ginsengisoli TaxID=400775 RepID=A0ABU0J095_9CAUL|nr:DMT family transporter [Caulobacter ginsengisoli]MDQ0466709.1 drug/metabolite transporter (DMT)-like permease [Caulobacter ginsengisoli]